MAIWVIKDGQREGPYDDMDVLELLYEGTYSEEDPAIRDGQFDWSTIGELLDTEPSFPDLEPADEEPPPPPLPEADEALTPEEPVEPPALPSPTGPPPPLRIAVTDFQMPFGSMVVFMLKWALAAIPALLILGFIAVVLWLLALLLMAAVLR